MIYVSPNSLNDLSITSTIIVGNKRYPIDSKALLKYFQSQEDSAFTEPSLIKILQIPSVTISNTRIEQHHFAKQGAFLDLGQNSNVTITNCVFTDLSASISGALYLNAESHAIIKDSTFSFLKAIQQGVLQVSVQSTIEIEDSKFIGNQAIQNGVFKISGDSTFNIRNVIFSENSAHIKNSIGQAIQIGAPSSLINCLFERNQASIEELAGNAKSDQQGKLIELITNTYKIEIQSSQFVLNTAPTGTSNLYILDSNDVQINKSQFKGNTQSNELAAQERYGDFIQIASSSIVTISSSSFNGGYALTGGAIHIIGKAILNVINSQFTDNIAIKQGGAIYADSFKNINFNKQSSFSNNIGQKGSGDALYIYNSATGNATFEDTFFHSTIGESNFIYASDLQEFSMKRISAKVKNTTQNNNTKFAGITIRNMAALNIFDSNFTGLKGTNQLGGGAISIEYTDDVLENQVLIKGCLFKDSQSRHRGGGLTLVDVKRAIIARTLFQNNSAQNQGGGLMFGCNASGILQYQCNLQINDTIFKENTAGLEGGAIKWNYYQPTFSKVLYQDNKARIYGDDIASVPAKLVQITKDLIGQKQFTLEQELSNLRQGSSGGEVQLYFGIIDKYGTFLRTDNKSKLFLQQG
ncbi:hypothetical protein FGO68_gene16005 [Halteria grandinella]|uniref:Right handed beta helix domain-containing protein n=1 Tax=Halteria grandinella TaxID=5974 RepID=A0A8J8P5Y6_HALGN|nr:hypothetical protein FGO68_gene16005 [Halteria grandinella]